MASPLSRLMRRRAVGTSLTLTVGAVLLLATSAQASPLRITRGGAEAVFQAFPNAGRTLLFRSATIEIPNGAPADYFGSNGAIRPFGGSPWDHAHFCSLDWHAIVITLFDGSEAGSLRSPKDIVAGLLLTHASFSLDGQPFETTSTAVKRFLYPELVGLVDAYGYSAGKVMKLEVGTHVLHVAVTDPIYGPYEDGIMFFVDGPGSVVCG